MGLLDHAAANTDQADLIILSHVETIRDQNQPATASAVASLIGGAPVPEIYNRQLKLVELGCLERFSSSYGFRVTILGEELLRRDLIGWSPSIREARRRESTLASASAGAYRRNGN
jgi:G3E family GTPase